MASLERTVDVRMEGQKTLRFLAWQDDYGPEYKRLMDAHRTLNDCKKAGVAQ
jgi:hypothetical protein